MMRPYLYKIGVAVVLALIHIGIITMIGWEVDVSERYILALVMYAFASNMVDDRLGDEL